MYPGDSGTLNYASAGPVQREKNNENEKKPTNPWTHTAATHHRNEPIHPPTNLHYSSTAVHILPGYTVIRTKYGFKNS